MHLKNQNYGVPLGVYACYVPPAFGLWNDLGQPRITIFYWIASFFLFLKQSVENIKTFGCFDFFFFSFPRIFFFPYFPYSPALEKTFFLLFLWVWLFFLDSTCKWYHGVFVFLCLAISLGIMPSRFIHAVTNDNISFSFFF